MFEVQLSIVVDEGFCSFQFIGWICKWHQAAAIAMQRRSFILVSVSRIFAYLEIEHWSARKRMYHRRIRRLINQPVNCFEETASLLSIHLICNTRQTNLQQ